MKFPSKYYLFLFGASLIFLFNLLIMNDIVSIWNGAEAGMISFVQDGADADQLAFPILMAKIFRGIYDWIGLDIFYLRLLNVALLLLAIVLFYYGAKRLFGLESTEWTLLIVASTFAVPAMAKMATSDIALMTAHLSTMLFFVLYTKQNRWSWLIAFYVSLFLGSWIHLPNTLIFFFVLSLGIFFFHPKGRAIDKRVIIAAFGLLLVVFLFSGWETLEQSFLLGSLVQNSGLSIGQYLLILVLGVLPWLGFVPAVLWDLCKKFSAKEELAIIGGIGILAGLLSKTLVPTWFLALFIGKHLKAFLAQKYPYSRVVIFFAVSNLILTFFVAFLMMMSGYLQFAALGFRSAVAIGATYWMFSLLGVIGLLAKSKMLSFSGLTASGLLVFFLFWSNVYPIIERSRGLSQSLLEAAKTINKGQPAPSLIIQTGLLPELRSLKIYAKEKQVCEVLVERSVEEIFNASQESLLMVEQDSSKNWAEQYEIKAISGRFVLLEEEKTIWVMKRKLDGQ